MIAIIHIIISALMWARAFAETILYYIRLYNSTEFVGAAEGVKFVAALARLPTQTQTLRDPALDGWIVLKEKSGLVVGT